MGLIPEGYLEPLQWFSEQLKSTLAAESPEDAQIVQKGLLLYRQGVVSQLKLDQDAVLATVQDVTTVKIKLDLNLLYLSGCSCPAEGMCRHQMAAFFQIFAHAGSVSDWVDDWRKPLREQKAAKTLGIERAKDLLKSTGHLKPNYENWKEAFSESFDSIIGHPKPYLVSELFSVYLRRLRAGAPFEQEWKNLYLLIAAVTSFEKLLQLSIEYNHDEEMVNRYYRHLFQDLIDDVKDLSSKLATQSLPFAFDDFIEPFKNDVSDLLMLDFELNFERVHLYRLLWSRLFKKKSWREEERDKLRSQKNDFPFNMGLIHLHFLLREDEEALALLQSCDVEITPYFLYWLDLLTAQRDWKRMEAYVIEFIARIKEYLRWQHDYYACREFMHLAARTITSFCTETSRFDLYEKALAQMLPYSFRDYEIFLFDKKEFEKWMELQTYVGFELASISNDRIKMLQSEAPSILLPLYHQAIQTDINGKNRDHYRQAVRKLKKLRTVYKKMKRLDDWEQFFDILLTRTKRLRAFHEECKRGKLIDA